MPLEAIITVKTVEISKNWITAKEANEKATSFINATFVKFMEEIMKEITKTAEAGKTSTSVMCYGANEEVYSRAMSVLANLGYTVSRPSKARYIYITWK